MMIVCKSCDKPMMCQPSPSYFKDKTARDFYRETKDYVCSTCEEAEFVKGCFDRGAEAVTILNGKPSPWTQFGMEPDPKKFSRGVKIVKKEEDNNGN